MASQPRLIDQVPLQPPDKQKRVKVLCFGAPRTGTTSLEIALEKIGYKTFAGMQHNFNKDNRWPLWTEALRAKHRRIDVEPYSAEDFDKFLGPYDAVAGWPASLFVDELVAAYPDAKVILTTRDPESWANSYFSTVIASFEQWKRWNWILPLCRGRHRDFRVNVAEDTAAFVNYKADVSNRDAAIKAYVARNEHIRHVVPKERLLELDGKLGYAPLCAFLGKEIPREKGGNEEAYPHTNLEESMNRAMLFVLRTAQLKALTYAVGSLGLAAIAVAVLWRLRDRLRLTKLVPVQVQALWSG